MKIITHKAKYWIYPVTMVGIVGMIVILASSCKKKDVDNNNNHPANTVTDIEGNVYQTVIIGTQVWMAENLKVTKFRNGDSIPYVTDSAQWHDQKTGAYYWYNNEIANKEIYGALYNWHAVNDSRKIAPLGWHIPTDEEWSILTNYLGGDSVAGGKMKEVGISHWISPNLGATNSSGFTALPGGGRRQSSIPYFFGYYGYWWTSTEFDYNFAWRRVMSYSHPNVYRYEYNPKEDGFSVRCIKD